jgi:hypothetical protein
MQPGAVAGLLKLHRPGNFRPHSASIEHYSLAGLIDMYLRRLRKCFWDDGKRVVRREFPFRCVSQPYHIRRNRGYSYARIARYQFDSLGNLPDIRQVGYWLPTIVPYQVDGAQQEREDHERFCIVHGFEKSSCDENSPDNTAQRPRLYKLNVSGNDRLPQDTQTTPRVAENLVRTTNLLVKDDRIKFCPSLS